MSTTFRPSEVISAFLKANKMTDGWRTRKSHRMGADPQGNNHVIRELEVLATATSLFPEREEALEINVINGQ